MEKEVTKFFEEHGKKPVKINKWWGSWELIPVYNISETELKEVKEGKIKYKILPYPVFFIYSIGIGVYFMIRNYKAYRAKLKISRDAREELAKEEVKK